MLVPCALTGLHILDERLHKQLLSQDKKGCSLWRLNVGARRVIQTHLYSVPWLPVQGA